MSNIEYYLNQIRDPIIRDQTERELRKLRNFMNAKGSLEHHHNYHGGLYDHTVETLENAEILIKATNKKLDSDLIYSALILHDTDKTTNRIRHYYDTGKQLKIHSHIKRAIYSHMGEFGKKINE